MDKEEIVYWKWKNTIIDFDAISNETIDYNGYVTKKDYIFYYLGTPDRQIHKWYNGGFSSEYNSALIYARQLGLVENYVDYENKICELEQQVREQKEVIDKAIDFIENGDLLYLANKNSLVYRNNVEVRAVADRLNNLLQILEDKEVSE